MWLLRETQWTGESGVQGQSWRQSMLEDSSSGWQLTMEPSQLSVWHDSTCKSASQIYDDCTKTSHPFWQTRHKTAVGALFPLSDHTHREEESKKWRKQLPVVGLDQCVNPHVVCRCQDALVLTHTSRKPFQSTCWLPKTFHSKCRPSNGVFKLGKWSIAALLMQNLCWLLPQGSLTSPEHPTSTSLTH